MAKKNPEYIHVLCTSRAYLAALNMMGPIVHPLKVTKKQAVALLMSGAKVYEYIPGSQLTFELTLSNVNDKSRYDFLKQDEMKKKAVQPTTSVGIPVQPVEVKSEVEKKEEAPVVETPVQPEPEVITPAVEEEAPADPEPEVAPIVEEPVVEEQVVETAVSKVDSYEFTLNENGKVDESKINWNEFTKEERKALRTRINSINAG